jgi:hypothetical protein
LSARLYLVKSRQRLGEQFSALVREAFEQSGRGLIPFDGGRAL